MKTLHRPTPAERSAHEIMCGLYRRDLDCWRDLGIRLPADHPQLAAALRALDRQIGFITWADDESAPAGEGCHRWCWHNSADYPPLTQADRYDGSTLADRLIARAAWDLHPATPVQVVEQAVDAIMEWGPRPGSLR